MSETHEDVDRLTAGDVEDFDAFWSQRERKVRATRIMGEDVTLPPSLPLQFELEARRLQDSKDEQDIKKLVGILFGTDKLDAWAEKGMDFEQFSVLLAWAPQVIAGQKVTLAEVADDLARAEAAEGDVARPTRRRNSSKKRSSGGS